MALCSRKTRILVWERVRCDASASFIQRQDVRPCIVDLLIGGLSDFVDNMSFRIVMFYLVISVVLLTDIINETCLRAK